MYVERSARHRLWHGCEADAGEPPAHRTIRVTTCLQDNHDHAKDCIDLSGADDLDDEYERNAQMAELNALNAALAVIKWKKIRGIYSDFGCELHCLYALDGNRLINCYQAKP